jgi:hypothetical protein
MMKTKLVSLLLFICTTVQAQDVTDIINGVLGGNSSSNEMVSNLTSVFSKNKQATQDKLIGTWSYTEPAIVFTSDNILAKVGSKIAANKLENKIQEYLTRYGIKPGAFTMTFNEDGTFTETLNGKTSKGKWTVKDSKLQLTIAGIKALNVTTQIDGKDLQFVTDATKLLNLFKTLGAKSGNSQIKTVTSLMKSVNGMQAGVTLRKQ